MIHGPLPKGSISASKPEQIISVRLVGRACSFEHVVFFFFFPVDYIDHFSY